MPYLWYPPTFLALPLEIRHNIYSYILIDQRALHLVDAKIFKENQMDRIRRSVFLTNRQIYREAFDYYYANNMFLITLLTPYYSLNEEVAASDVLERRLSCVQRLTLVIETSKEQRLCSSESDDYSFPRDALYPRQQVQWGCFVDLVQKSKHRREARILMQLTIEDLGWEEPSESRTLEAAEIEGRVYALLLLPVREMIGEISFGKHALRCL